jgi:hypothetical protein
LSVFHGDIESGLGGYPDQTFDTVILNQSMQEVASVDFIIAEALRVGRKVIVGFPNFANIKARIDLFFLGTAPVNESLPYRWYDTPNIHFLSIRDFVNFCSEKDLSILKAVYLGKERLVRWLPNLFGAIACLLRIVQWLRVFSAFLLILSFSLHPLPSFLNALPFFFQAPPAPFEGLAFLCSDGLPFLLKPVSSFRHSLTALFLLLPSQL